MLRLAALLLLCLLATATLGAQCFVEPDATHANLGTGDDTLFAPRAIGFAFPHLGTTYTDVHVSTNGLLYLSNGGVPAPGSANGDAGGGYGTAAAQRQTLLGGAPKILPFYRDLTLLAVHDAGVFVRAGTPGPTPTPCVVTWRNAVDFDDLTPPKTIQCQLHPNGTVELFYDSVTEVLGAAPATVGQSPAAGASDPGASDLGAAPTTGNNTIYEQFATGTFDLAGKTLRLAPTLPGQTVTVRSCEVGTHTVLGAGCYGDSFYQLFAETDDAWLALEGHSLTLQPTATGYQVSFSPGGASAFVPPTGAVDFVRSDDGQAVLDLQAHSLPNLSVPGGSTSTLWVHMNGIVSTTGPGNDDGAWNTPANDFTPTPWFRNAPATAFWAWHDYNPADLAGNPVRWHYDATLGRLYITWDGVENWSQPATNNPGTFQFQFELATGVVHYLWVTIDTNTTSAFGSAHLVGYSPGGNSVDPGSIPLGTAGGTTTIDGLAALRLGAAPRPVLDGGIGPSNTISYTVDHMPDYAPPSGVRLGILFFSATPAPGLDLGIVGAPGCQTYVGGLEVALPIAQVGGATQAIAVTFPAPLAAGTTFHAQAVALIPANSLPGGLNAFGLLTSNGLATSF